MGSIELERAIAAIKAGRKKEARPVLVRLVSSEPHNVPAWFWLVETLPDRDSKLRALERCVQLNPDDQTARRALEIMKKYPAQAPRRGALLAGKPPRLTPEAAPTSAQEAEIPVAAPLPRAEPAPTPPPAPIPAPEEKPAVQIHVPVSNPVPRLRRRPAEVDAAAQEKSQQDCLTLVIVAIVFILALVLVAWLGYTYWLAPQP